ncbi:MAG: cytochrome c4 [Alphaproteobacteria bacterium]|nr:MAG: cytochrome c4 [Alphaproteobacteria bacterium]
MTRLLHPLVLVAAILALAAGNAAAQKRITPSPQIEDQVAQCLACHGEDGRPAVEDAPIIFGQELYYLFVQLRDFAAGRRESEIMTPIASELDRKQMEALAKYFSEQKWPTIQAASTDEQRTIGERIGSSGQCPQCHLGGYNGVSRNPRLAGQTPEYLEKTMLDFKYRRRKNAPDKSVLIESYSDEDLAAMANYLAGF